MNTSEIGNLNILNDDYLFIIAQTELLVRDLLEVFAQSSQFFSQMQEIFGEVDVTGLQEQWKIREVDFPEIKVVSSEEIMGAKGAFSKETNAIYLSRKFLRENIGSIVSIAEVVLEELGHSLDEKLHPNIDTKGDEGELFAAMVKGKELTDIEIQRIKQEDDNAIATINGERLEIEQANYNLGLVEGNQSWLDSIFYQDEDYYTFQISGTGTSSNYISVSSSSTSIDLALELYDQYGYYVDSADSYGSNYNYESLYLTGLTSGTYTVKVYDYHGGYYVYPYSADYTLTIDAPQSYPDLTLYQPDTWSDGIVISTTSGTNTDATIITTDDYIYVDGAWINQGLGTTNQEFTTYLLLNETVIGTQNSLTLDSGFYDGFTDFLIAPLPAGNHTLSLEIDSFNSISESDEANNIWTKTFTVVGPSIPQDDYESNDSFVQATLVNSGISEEIDNNQIWLFNDLSIHSITDTDFFKFTLDSYGTAEHLILALVNSATGDIDFNLYDSYGYLIDNTYWTASGEGSNYISLEGLPVGDYYVQVGSFEGNLTENYSLGFSLPKSLASDSYEPNDSVYANLGKIDGFKQIENLSIHTSSDLDFFWFEITEQPNSQHYVAIDFDNFQGDLDLILYNSEGSILDYQFNNTDGEVISLWGLPVGSYGLGVYSAFGETNQYSLIINAPGNTTNIGDDIFESNNSQANAKNLQTIDYGWQQGTGFKVWNYLSISQGDEDWFEFELKEEAKSGHFVAIALDYSQGDIDLELYNDSGTKIKESKGTRDLESINLEDLDLGTYYIRVLGYKDATNPNYTLGIYLPGGDIFEDNDIQNFNEIEGENQAADLTPRRTKYLTSWDNLSIEDNDVDWFKFNLPSKGTANDYVGISFDHSLGDLDIELYDQEGEELDSSAGVSNSESISLQNLASGDYYIKVFGYADDTNPNYGLTINAPISNPADSFESNDTRSEAENLNDLLQQGQQTIILGDNPEKPLSIHSNTDVDWFKFTIADDGKDGNYAAIAFDHTLGDLDFQLYSSSGQLLETSDGVANVHQIDLKDQTKGTYYLKIFGYNGATNPTYILTVDAPFNAVSEDWSESNETVQEAKDLGTINREFNRGNLSITEDDIDWFKFEIASQGTKDNYVGINFNHQQGDLDIELYETDGTTLIDSSESVSNNETISLNGYNAGVYYLKVYGYSDAINPDYELIINAPEDTSGDWAEVNDSKTTAYDLRNVEGFQTWDTLSLHNGTDQDWFKFTTLGTADAQDYVRIDFDNTQGDVDLYLYNSTGSTLLGKSETAEGFEKILLENTQGSFLSAGTYLVQVKRHSQNTDGVDYQLSIHAFSDSEADWAESNDTKNDAEDLQEVQGTKSWTGLSIDQGGDDDWFKFETIGTGVEGHGVSINFDHSEGDLQLYLYDDSGSDQPIASSTGNSNRELISFKDRSAGTYYVKIEGESSSVTNPNYTLTFDLPETSESDWIDAGNTPNNSRTNAYDLRTITDALLLSGLSIHPSTDTDWFKFTLPQNAVNGQVVRIDFNHFEGNLQLELFDSNGNRIGQPANTTRNFEEISLAGKNAGTYYVKVSGVNNSSNPNYSLTITGIPEAQPDQLEPNDSPQDAYGLRDLASVAQTNNSAGRSVFSFDPNTGIQYDPLQGQSVAQFVGEGFNQPYVPSLPGYQPVNHSDVTTAGFEIGGWIHSLTSGAFNFTNLNQLASQDPLGAAFLNQNEQLANQLLNGGLDQQIQGIFQGIQNNWNIHQNTFNQIWSSIPSNNFNHFAFQPGLGNQNYTDFGNTITSLGLGNLIPQNTGSYNPNLNFTFNYLQNAGVNINPFLNQPAAASSGLSSLLSAFGLPARSGNSQNLAAIPNLSIHSNTDQDWFQFELTQDGQAGQFIAINFDHDLGDLKLELFEGFNSDIYETEEEYQQFLVATQNGSGDSEQISLARLAKGEYYIRVSGVDGATNSNYSLSLTAPLPNEEISEDFAEPNNSSSNPYDLREVEGNRVLSGLSIHNNEDKDWFQFKTRGVGADGHVVRIDFSDDQGDLDLILYHQNGTEIARSETTENFEAISLNGLVEGTYKIEVLGYDGATNPNYTLSLSTPDNSVEPDRFEPNDDNDLNRLTTGDLDNATNLDQFENLSTLSGLSIHTGDEDFFKFTTTSKASQNHSVSIEYEGGQGELELTLYQLVDSTTVNTINSSSTGVDNKTVWLTDDGTATGEGLADGTYYIHVTGEDETVANNYQLFVDVPNEVTETPAEPQLDDWTIMVYMTASDLAEYAFSDINEMEYAVSQLPGTVNFAVLWDQSETYTQTYDNGITYTFNPYATPGETAWGDTGRAIIKADSNNTNLLDPTQNQIVTPFERIGEQNTGDPETLTNFVNWAKDAAPAENYALVMWDHGSGDLFGFNGDDEGNSSNPNKDSMFTYELVSVLDNLKTTDNFTFDLISFDACLMAMAEVGYALKDYTDIFVASQEIEGGDGYDYTTAFSVLRQNPDQITTEALASGIVSSYQQQYQGDQRQADTHSASNTNGFSNLVTTIKTFTDAVIQNATNSDWNAIYDAYSATTGFNYEFYRDLGQFVQGIANNSVVNTAIRQAAQAVDLALENLVIAQTTDQRNTNGLSVFLPDNYWLNVLNNNYSQEIQEYLSNNQDFFDTTGWLDFINAFLANKPNNRNNISSDWAGNNNVSARAYNFNTLVGDNHQFTGLNLETADDQDWYRFTITETATVGDKVTITYDKTNGQTLNFLLRYTNSNDQSIDKTATPTTTGQEISLAGLSQGEYRILVEANGSIIPDYSLSINAPGTPTNGNDWTRSNNISTKAEDLGVMTGTTFFSGLQVNSLQPDWFEFELPKVNSDQITPITVTIDPTGNQSITAQLFDPSDVNNAIATKTGTDEIHLTTPNPQPGETYQLKISSSSAIAYSLAFALDLDFEFPRINIAPEQLQFNVSVDGNTVNLTDAWIYDEDGSQDISYVDLWVKKDGGTWQDIDDITNFNTWSNNNNWAIINHQIDCSDYEYGSYQLWAKGYDQDGLESNTVTQTFTINNINPSPTGSYLKIDKQVYTSNDTLNINNGWVRDLNGVDDIQRIDFWLRKEGEAWQDIEDISRDEITPWEQDTTWGSFDYSLGVTGLTPGSYTLWSGVQDQTLAENGTWSNIVENHFEIINTAPSQLMFNTDKKNYNPTETLVLENAWVYDEDGYSDITNVDFRVQNPAGEWIDVGDVNSFTPWSDNNDWSSFEYSLDLEELGGSGIRTHSLQGQATDSSGATSDLVTQTFTIDNITPSSTGLDGYFDIDGQVYTSNDTLNINNGWVRDLNGVDDIQRIDFWLRKEGEAWQDIEDISRDEITPWEQDTTWGSFDYSLGVTELTPGSYTLWSGVQDQTLAENGTWANIVQNNFEIQV